MTPCYSTSTACYSPNPEPLRFGWNCFLVLSGGVYDMIVTPMAGH